MRTTMRLLLTAAFSAAALSGARADQINVDLNYFGSPLDVTTNNIAGLTNGAHTFTGGLMSLDRNSGSTVSYTKTPAGGGFGTVGIAAYCIDLLQTIELTNDNYDIVPVSAAPKGGVNVAMGAAKAQALATLWALAVNPTNAAQLSSANPNYVATQLAIWEIVYEPILTFDLSAGDFQKNNVGADYTLAQTLLNTVSATYLLGATPKATLLAFAAPSGDVKVGIQDLIVEVPEAANVISLAAIALAAGVFNLKRLRRRQDSQA